MAEAYSAAAPGDFSAARPARLPAGFFGGFASLSFGAGLAGRQFRLVKFRTMLEAYDPEGQLLPDADRMTRFGSSCPSGS